MESVHELGFVERLEHVVFLGSPGGSSERVQASPRLHVCGGEATCQ
jgi:hypothetical protein